MLRERLQAYHAERKATFVVIEHQMEFVMALCTRVLVLAEGRVIAEGAPQEIRREPGGDRSLSRPVRWHPHDRAEPILVLDGVFAGYGKMTILNGTTARIRRGAITTVIGPNGAGKSTLFKTIFGLLPVRDGTITFDGRSITNFSPRDILDAGVAYVPQGRNIFPELSVRHNLELGGVALPDQAELPARLESDHAALSDVKGEGGHTGFDAVGRPAKNARGRARSSA